MTASTYLVSAGDFWPFQIPGKRRSHILTKCVLPSNSAKHSNGAQWLWETGTGPQEEVEGKQGLWGQGSSAWSGQASSKEYDFPGQKGQCRGAETGEARAAQGSRKLHDSCLSWLLSFRWFSSATFRLIPFAKLSWQSPWMRLGGKSLALSDPVQALSPCVVSWHLGCAAEIG